MKQNRLAIIRLLLKLSALDYRRSNAYGEGKGARIIIAVAGIIFWASLTWLGLLMADQVKSYGMTTANGGSYGATPVGYICGVMPFILFVDFMLRLSFLHSNTQYAKPFFFSLFRDMLVPTFSSSSRFFSPSTFFGRDYSLLMRSRQQSLRMQRQRH